jgi:transcriptional regulator with XRE-family HTH domain
MNTQHEIVGQNIRQFRERMQLSQNAVADYLGVARETISYYENGNRPAPTSHLQRLADLFGIDAYDFFEADAIEQDINVAFAFRADTLTTEDLDSIAAFRRIVNNYRKMKKRLANDNQKAIGA